MCRIAFKTLSLVLCLTLFVTYFGVLQTAWADASAEKLTGTVTVSDCLNVRTGPGTEYSRVSDGAGNSVVLYPGVVVNILNSIFVGNVAWYHVSFVNNEEEITGYVSSAYVRLNETRSIGTVSDDFDSLLLSFPKSYRDKLLKLHEKYPKWKFVAFDTNLDWNTVIEHESVLGRSLISTKNQSYRSTQEGAYDWLNDRWIALDGSAWYQAAPDVIKYYMDPRNFLDEKYIFQFEALSYDRSNQNIDGVRAMLRSSFMESELISNGNSSMSYADTFMCAAEASGVSPYHLAARVIQEVGVKGSQSVRGTTTGYEGIYNFYNIGASSSANPVLNGLKFANTGGGLSAAKKSKYLIPWNSKYKSVVGGAVYIGANYINVGQNTLYLEKFDVDASDGSLYWHQYMTNVAAASSEAVRIYNAYNKLGSINERFVFYVPVFNNMPEENCVLPNLSGNPNNILSALSVNGYELTPSFNALSKTRKYYLILGETTTSINVSASAASSVASVSGDVGPVSLRDGVNRLAILVTAENGCVNTYEIIIVLNNENFSPGDEDKPNIPAATEPETTAEPTTTPAPVIVPSEPPTEPLTTEPATEPLTTELVTEPVTEPRIQSRIDSPYDLRDRYVSGINPGTNVGALLGGFSVTGNASVSILDKNGENMANEVVGTGCIIKTVIDGVEHRSTVVIRGDVSGDGAIGAVDLLMVRKEILGTYSVDEPSIAAGDINGDGSVGAIDLLMIRKYILGTYEISR